MKLVVEIDLPDGATPHAVEVIKQDYPTLVHELLVGGTHLKAARMIAYMGKIGKTQEEIKKLTDVYEYQAEVFGAMRMHIE